MRSTLFATALACACLTGAAQAVEGYVMYTRGATFGSLRMLFLGGKLHGKIRPYFPEKRRFRWIRNF